MKGEEQNRYNGKNLAELLAIKPEAAVYCPRCQSEDIEEVIIDKAIERMSIDDIGKVGTSIHVPVTYRLTCKNCEYYKEYTI